MPKLVKDEGTGREPLAIIGEAPGAAEDVAGRPFVGVSGMKLAGWMREWGLGRGDAYWTNVYPYRPPANKLKAIPPAELGPWRDALHSRIAALHGTPILVPTGDTALRTLLGPRSPSVTKARGSIYSYTDANGRKLKVIPTIHPAAILRQPTWERRCRRDWSRIRADMAFPTELRLPVREHFIRPTLGDCAEFLELAAKADTLTIDIETPRKLEINTVEGRPRKDGTRGKSRTTRTKGAPRVTCVGLSISPEFSITIPTTLSYWGGSEADLAAAWEMIRLACALPIPKSTQNGLFDAFWLWLEHDVWLRNWRWDTRWLHHALEPLDTHSLAYMASVDTREPYWKDDAKDGDDLGGDWADIDVFWRYCLDEDTPVLMADLRWKPLKEIAIGDKILSVDETGGVQRKGKEARRWRIAEVTEVHSFMRPCSQVVTEDGGHLIATGDHEVLTDSGGGKRWLRVDHLRSDTLKSSLLRPFVPWGGASSTLRAWMGGFLDGEGSISGTKDGVGKRGGKYGFGYLSFSQNPGLVWDRAESICKEDGFDLYIHKSKGTHVGYVRDGVRSAIRALGYYRPIRLIQNLQDIIERGHIRATSLNPTRVAAITPAGVRRVIDIKTTSRTFIANGFVVHNCGKDAAVQSELTNLYATRVTESGRLAFYLKHYQRMFYPLLRMSVRGLRLDTRAAARTLGRLTADCMMLADRLEVVAGERLHGKTDLSVKRLQRYLYETLHLPKHKDRKTGALTTKEVVVRKLMLKFPAKLGSVDAVTPLTDSTGETLASVLEHQTAAGPAILAYRRKSKLRSFVKEGIADADGRVRTQYGFVETGRLSSSKNPRRTGQNLQNHDRDLRHVFLPEPGMFFLEVDESQGEDRIVKCLTGSPRLIARAQAAPWENDEHKRAAAVIWPHLYATWTDVPSKGTHRYLGKRTRHAGNYGLGGQTFAEELLKDGVVMDSAEAGALIETLLDKDTPEVRTWQQGVRATIMRDRCIANSWGRMWDFTFERLDDALYRFGYACVPQSELVEIVNQWGLIPLDKLLRTSGMQTVLHHQNHDSLLVSTVIEEAYDVACFLRESLERPRTYNGTVLTIPIEVKCGRDWSLPLEFKQWPSREEFEGRVAAMLAGAK